MIWLVILFALAHAFFFIILAIKWKKIQHITHNEELRFSIVVPVRNEADTIGELITCLSKQRYPNSKFEVIIVNDFSEDTTVKIASHIASELSFPVKIISLENKSEKGKKYAITKGVEESKFEYIITTDADCRMGVDWVLSYARYFGNNKMLAGPVSIKNTSFFARLQQLEFAGLIGFGAVTIEANNASMCSGANLGFSKEAFLKVDGYKDNIHIPSGDDEFLLYNILKHYPREVAFIKDKDAIVTTQPHTSLISFINQRTRWTSKWKHNKNWKLRTIAVLFFLDYFTVIGLYVGIILGWVDLITCILIILLRFTGESYFILSVNRFMDNKRGISSLLLLQFIYPFHVILMGLKSIFGNYTWKGRKY